MSPGKAFMTLLSGTGAGFALRLVRNILIARLISVEDYGIASTFTVAVSLLSMATNMSFGKLIVQSRDGDDAGFIYAINGMIVARGLVMFIVLFVTAGLMARMFGQPELAWAYQIVALMPLITAFRHTDFYRLNRALNFKPQIYSDVLPLGITVLAAWPVTLYFGDFRVMIVILLIEVLTGCLATHLVAERPYKIRLRWDVARQSLRFGWPLLVGSLAVFATQQGDRIIVANHFGAYQLGLFSAALTLVMPAALQTAHIADGFFLPLLSKVQDDAARFAARATFALQVTLCLGLAATIGYCLLGQPVMLLVFGPRYAEAGALVGPVGAMFALQVARAGATVVAVSKGHTLNLLFSNLVRVAFLPAALAIAYLGGDVFDVVIAGIIGQVAAYGASIGLLRFWTRVEGLGQMFWPYVFAAASFGAMMAAVWTSPDMIARPGPLTALSGVCFLAMLWSCQILRREALTRLPALLRRGG